MVCGLFIRIGCNAGKETEAKQVASVSAIAWRRSLPVRLPGRGMYFSSCLCNAISTSADFSNITLNVAIIFIEASLPRLEDPLGASYLLLPLQVQVPDPMMPIHCTASILSQTIHCPDPTGKFCDYGASFVVGRCLRVQREI